MPYPGLFLSPSECQSAPAGCETPPRVQTLTLARSESPTQTHRAATVSASLSAVLQEGHHSSKVRQAKQQKQGKDTPGKVPVPQGLCWSVDADTGEQELNSNSSEAQRPVSALGKGSEQQETTPGEGSPSGPSDSVPQPC